MKFGEFKILILRGNIVEMGIGGFRVVFRKSVEVYFSVLSRNRYAKNMVEVIFGEVLGMVL